jgi:hypothetical protein
MFICLFSSEDILAGLVLDVGDGFTDGEGGVLCMGGERLETKEDSRGTLDVSISAGTLMRFWRVTSSTGIFGPCNPPNLNRFLLRRAPQDRPDLAMVFVIAPFCCSW